MEGFRSIFGEDRLQEESLSTGSPAGRNSKRRRRLKVQSGQRKSHGNRSLWPERSRPLSWSLKRCLREANGPTKDARDKKQKSTRGWKGVRPGMRLDGQSGEEHKR